MRAKARKGCSGVHKIAVKKHYPEASHSHTTVLHYTTLYMQLVLVHILTAIKYMYMHGRREPQRAWILYTRV